MHKARAGFLLSHSNFCTSCFSLSALVVNGQPLLSPLSLAAELRDGAVLWSVPLSSEFKACLNHSRHLCHSEKNTHLVFRQVIPKDELPGTRT